LTNFFVEFKKLNFSYENKGKKVLNDVDLIIKSGTTVAIIGETGSGKSTIAKLLLNIYKVSPGELFINNLDINDISTKSLRKYIQIVPQDITLFNKSILYNLKYGNSKASFGQIRAICKSLLLDSFINSLPNKYETIVGERGLLLSGGEKQKIAIDWALRLAYV
jgi:ATP-binding cassette subfamily B protein